ncbi:MAG TPA: hypothetical protein VE444_01395 [Gaiellaceae bacterium]|jgi:hypothetical protein|nr:hypothetical protein [Gaiellaceae bacterium]
MRRIVVFLTLCALAVPAAAFGLPRAIGDGTLAVRDLNGFFVVQATRGAIVGRCDKCTLRIEELRGDTEIDPRVFGANVAVDLDGDGDNDRFFVRDGRWKLIGGGAFLVRVSNATDADISLVGRGRVSLRGTAGTYSVNGGDSLAVETELTTFQLRASTP